MQNHELVDIAPKNRRYTWCNRRIGRGNIMERLDIILVVVSLLSQYSIAITNVLPFAASDHYPITLTFGDHHSLGPIPFKYNPLWNDIQEENQLVRNVWMQHIEGSPSFIWETKLKKIKLALKEWTKNHYKEQEKSKIDLKSQLDDVHSSIETQGLNQDRLAQEKNLYWQLYRANRKEEEKWKIKSRNL